MFNGSDDATALLAMPGFRAGARIDEGGEWWIAVETTTDAAWLRHVRHAGGRPRPSAGQGPGPADGGPAGGAGVGQADLALPRRRLPGGGVDRRRRRDRPALVADRAGPRRDVPPGRPEGALGRRRRPGLRRRLAHGHGGGDRSRPASSRPPVTASGPGLRTPSGSGAAPTAPSRTSSPPSAPGSRTGTTTPSPFVWHKTADEILDGLAKYCQRISDSGH